jgi:hypothetical protein
MSHDNFTLGEFCAGIGGFGLAFPPPMARWIAEILMCAK